MLKLSAATLAALVALTGAVPSTWKHVSHEKRSSPGTDWIRTARIEPDAILPMRIGLAQTNLDDGYDYLMEVSDPASAKYGQHWTAEMVHDAFAPPSHSVDAVKEWLTSAGVHHDRIVHSDNKGWLAFDATAEEAEKLLLAEFYEHEHRHSSKLRVGCDEYHVPEHVQEHIDYITPGVKLTQIVKHTVKRNVVAKRAVQSTRAHRLEESPFGSPDSAGFTPPNYGSLSPDLRGCGFNITPACIKALYQIPNAWSVVPGNSLGLYEQGDYFSESDLDAFYKMYAPYVPQGTYPKPALIDGAIYSAGPTNFGNGGEADIDIDMAYSLIYPQSVTLYQVDDTLYAAQDLATTNLFNTFLDALDGSYCTYSAYGETGNDPEIDPVYPDRRPGGYTGKLQCGVYKPTKVISASYGQAEADLPSKYSQRQCNEFMKLGLQGHSIMVAAGDYGVASIPGDGSASGCLGPQGTIFNPQYPSNCPYITSVGGTQIYADQTVYDPESVMHVNLTGSAQNFSSAGGFSNYYPQPKYQQAAVSSYFANYPPPYPYYETLNVNVNTTKGLYNRIGRAYPDVAANGANFRAYTNGTLYFWYGTSLASPLFASVITLLNEERALNNKTSVGFLNPVLYSHPEILNDIRNGTNVGCGSEGFAAVPGWDPATGLGTPNYPKMRDLFCSLP